MLIALCGYMGCGKSTVGKLLAEKIGYDFLDTDLYIEENQGKSIPEIFANIGEDGFRKIETQAINNTLELKNTVISLGGGAVLKNENKQLLKNAFVIFLNSSFEDCYTRICNSTRPIVKAKTKEQLQEHFCKDYHIIGRLQMLKLMKIN